MDSDTKIFAYRDVDGREVWGDPLAIDRDLCLLLDGQPNQVIADFNSENAELARPAAEKLINAVCEAFALGPPFDRTTGKGARLETILAALDAFTTFMESKKKSVGSSPTSPLVTDSPGLQATENTLASTSTAPAFGSNWPFQQPLASALP